LTRNGFHKPTNRSNEKLPVWQNVLDTEELSALGIDEFINKRLIHAVTDKI
jgi:hypothetical protein